MKIGIAGALLQCLAFPCDHGRPQGGQWEIWKLGQERKICRKPEVSSLIDLILAVAVLFSDTTLTLRKSRVHCCGVMQF